MSDLTPPISHMALSIETFQAVFAYIGARPSSETAELLIALKAAQPCNLIFPAAPEAVTGAGVMTGAAPEAPA